MNEVNNNFNLTGDEARALMLTLANATVELPSYMVINLWARLNQIHQVQPPRRETDETPF